MWVSLLLVAWAAAFVSCARLCRAAMTAADGRLPEGEHPGAPGPSGPPAGELGPYETAFLAGGPGRVTDVTLVSMSGQRRLLLAHTGWATVVDPVGRDEVERSLIASIGPRGQSPVAAIRASHAAADAVRALGDRLAAAGLAVPAATRDALRAGIRQTAGAAGLVLALLVVTAGLGVPGGEGPWQLWWFALPLLLTVGCLLIARAEVRAWTRWAAPAGVAALRAIPAGAHRPLLALAVGGADALPDPALRAALAPVRRRYGTR
ncbi:MULTISPECIES: TIGR04222 domain-containing membrane protein [Streptomycetaceae]|uniref:Integral membrane protein n=1 Tax=Streptantibioticus cattleyicolor (strain ATCC 35852 / DSM 46488 / JCM 4925 / NBRC 14057 / NRRL 8057) TaxID=1003195 RepID=F8JWQ6_STREN|nr:MULTISPECIES: TIGR04222 domain-containing membrane protein [Streptomycetaceae]AEW97054.1 integral membrane protein [Streptantibioticus cattleyicolor NRRL 8057 = DSM 46488]MYS61519.1 TIGR04222 domain-containing membrane protein [Streptomyces sp. SID5468]CCB77379.1 putative integral membrane protein [Streptantibioticus cattleyicolor NRRL 8057 = DSM 46488]